MARQFGIISTSEGIADAIIQTKDATNAVEVADVRDESGKMIERRAYSESTEVSVDAILDAAAPTVKAGDLMVSGGKNLMINSVQEVERNTDFVHLSINASNSDNALLVTLPAGSN